MNKLNTNNDTQATVNKAGRKTKLAISPRSPEEHLNTIADIIIERMLEERKKNTTL